MHDSLLRTSVTAYMISKNTFICLIWNFFCENRNLKANVSKNILYNPPNGVLTFCKVLFTNGSYCNGVCKAFWGVCKFLLLTVSLFPLALILATPMGILYKIAYIGDEVDGLKPFCTPYETEHAMLKRKKDGYIGIHR